MSILRLPFEYVNSGINQAICGVSQEVPRGARLLSSRHKTRDSTIKIGRLWDSQEWNNEIAIYCLDGFCHDLG